MKDKDLKCVQSEGMPMYRQPYEKGQLFVQFQVRLTDDLITSINDILWLEYIYGNLHIRIFF